MQAIKVHMFTLPLAPLLAPPFTPTPLMPLPAPRPPPATSSDDL